MANLNELDDWPSGVYQYADGDVLDGGPESTETLPLRQLAARARYQRLRNVTPWDALLAAANGYPAGACVFHSGVTWRAKVPNNAEPGTDPAKWERWGYSASELMGWAQSQRVSFSEDFAINVITEIDRSVPGAQTLVGETIVANSPTVTVTNSSTRTLRYVLELQPPNAVINYTALGAWRFAHQLEVNGVISATLYSPPGQMNAAGGVAEVAGASGNITIDSYVLSPGQSITVRNKMSILVSSAVTTSAAGFSVKGSVVLTRCTN